MTSSPTYFERVWPTKAVAEGYRKLKEYYPPDKYPRLNAQWDACIAAYEASEALR